MGDKSLFNNALAELEAFYDFCMDVSELPTDEMVKRVEERYPEFIEHIETIEKSPKDALEFWTGFVIWTHSKLKSKYPRIWHEVVAAYFSKGINRQLYDKWKFKNAIWSCIDEVLENSNF